MKKTLSTGKTSCICRTCQAVSVIENIELETMAEFRCRSCGTPMSAARFAKMKMQYYAALYNALITPPFGGEGPEMFQVRMDFSPHYE